MKANKYKPPLSVASWSGDPKTYPPLIEALGISHRWCSRARTLTAPASEHERTARRLAVRYGIRIMPPARRASGTSRASIAQSAEVSGSVRHVRLETGDW